MIVPCLSQHKGASNVIVRQRGQNKEERYLFTQCIVRLCSSLPHDTADAKSVYGFQTNYTGRIWKKIKKNPSRTRIEGLHQFVATGSGQGFAP